MDAVLLSGYDAKRCARRVHNEWDPTVERVAWEVPPELQMRFVAGREFEAVVLAELRAALGPERYVDLTTLQGTAATDATVEAMAAGVEVIIGGRLPDDIEGGRTGRPDLLLRVEEASYVPGDVKGHLTVRRSRGELGYSRLAEPGERRTASGRSARTERLDDHLQLAHYWRMLEAIGRAPAAAPTGFIIGTDDLPDLDDSGRVLTWLDLAAPLFETYSRSRGRAKRSAMERYDHEQGFRLKVATASARGEPALVEPIFTDECDGCPWLDHCRSIAGDVASAAITSGRLTVREWQALGSAGVVSVDDLAALDPAAPGFREGYLPEVTHVKHPLDRLADAVRRARMTRDGVLLERRTTGAIDVPRADVEIDFDIEWDQHDRVYLWGALVHRAGADPAYHAVDSWEELDDTAAGALAEEFAAWLRGQIAEADAAGRTLLVYHYSNPEPRYLERALGKEQVADLTARFVDLLPIVREHYFGRDGHGIKKVAPAFGFQWRDDDPGGPQSQLWLLEARADGEAARQRILAYNEDDVRATAAVRNGLDGG